VKKARYSLRGFPLPFPSPYVYLLGDEIAKFIPPPFYISYIIAKKGKNKENQNW
jgi:hypothetical protein